MCGQKLYDGAVIPIYLSVNINEMNIVKDIVWEGLMFDLKIYIS